MPKFKDAMFEALRDYGDIEVSNLFIVIQQPGTTDGVMLRWNCTLPAALGACAELAAMQGTNLDNIPSLPGKTRVLDA